MKYILLVVFVATAVLAKHTEFHETIDEFEEEFHEKESPEEHAKHAEELAKVEEEINAENAAFDAGEASFDEKLYPWSDDTKEEFEKEKEGALPPPADDRWSITGHYNGLIAPPEDQRHSPESDAYLKEFYDRMMDRTLPASYNAITEGFITTVKNQGSCGSCAAFAAETVIETCMLKAGTPVAAVADLDLAEEYLLDCGYDGNCMSGCNGACVHSYPVWLKDNGGTSPHEAQMAYTASTTSNTCPGGDPSTVAKWGSGAKVTDVAYDYSCTEDKMKALVVSHGAVATGVYASDSSFGNYASGVYTGCSTGVQSNHAVTVVGYGTEGGMDYWLVKNSWGPGWGDGGYIKIKRGVSECNVGQWCTVASCALDGAIDAVPGAPPTEAPTTKINCDLSMYFGSLTGTYHINLGMGWKKMKCDAGQCAAEPAGPSNGCIYLCGNDPC